MSSAPLLDELEDELRASFLEYTRRAFGLLPEMAAPRILDVGCGAGVPTAELARISGGTVTALDTDAEALRRLERRVREAGLQGSISTSRCSMDDIDFPDGHFDLIWAEGSVQFLGFRKALTQWRRVLRPGGFLVLHDEMRNMERKLELVPACGYELLAHLALPEEAWWDDYYRPLEQRLGGLYEAYETDREAITVLDAKRNEVEMVKRNPAAFRSFFLVLRRTPAT